MGGGGRMILWIAEKIWHGTKIDEYVRFCRRDHEMSVRAEHETNAHSISFNRGNMTNNTHMHAQYLNLKAQESTLLHVRAFKRAVWERVFVCERVYFTMYVQDKPLISVSHFTTPHKSRCPSLPHSFWGFLPSAQGGWMNLQSRVLLFFRVRASWRQRQFALMEVLLLVTTTRQESKLCKHRQAKGGLFF